MTPTLLHAVARRAEAAAPDADLLGRFVRDRDGPAFEELVRRHGPLVWSVCRQVLACHADAEDAFQAVFLTLARSAADVRDPRAVAAWLHGAALRVATRSRRGIARRRARGAAAVPEADRAVSGAAWESLLAAVHEEVQRLPQAERTAFVLCDLEGVSQADAAARLGWPLGSLSGRLCKARQRLLARLTARGVAPGVAVGIGVTAGAASAVPAPLFEVVKLFPGSPGAASFAATALARGVTEGLTMRAKLMAATVLVTAAFGLGGGAAWLAKADAQPPAPPGAPGPGGVTGGGTGLSPNLLGPGAPPAPGSAAAARPGAWPSGGTDMGVGGWAVAAVAPAAWEYKFVDRDNTSPQFEKTLAQLGNEGWEYCGSETIFGRAKPGAGNAVIIFKRKKGADSPSGAAPGVRGGGGARPSAGGPAGMGSPMPGSPTAPMGGDPLGGGKAAGVTITVITLKHAKADQLAEVLGKVFAPQGVEVTPDPRTNQLVVRSDDAAVPAVKRVVEQLDVSVPK